MRPVNSCSNSSGLETFGPYNVCQDLPQGLKLLDTDSTWTVIFSSLDLFNSLHVKAINCCGTVRPNQKGMHSDFRRKVRLKWSDIKTRVKANVSCRMERQTKYKYIDKYSLSFSRR
jgi:hypothetical protein